MEGEFYLTNYLVCIFDVFLMFDFVSYYEGTRSYFAKRHQKVIVILLVALAIFGVNLFNSTTINLLCTLIVNFLFIWAVMNGSLAEKCMHFLVVLAVQYGGEFLASAFFAKGMSQAVALTHYTQVFEIIFVKLLTFIIFTLIKQLVPQKENCIDTKTFLMFMTVPIASLGIMFFITYLNIDFSEMPLKRGVLTAFYFLLIIGNVLIYYFFQKYGSAQHKNLLQEKLIAEQEIELRHYQQVENINRRNAKFHHDMNHYLKLIGNLAESDQNEKILSLLKELQVEFNESQKSFYCSNSIINTVLNEEWEEAKEKKIPYDIYVEPGFNIGRVHEADIVSILGNLYKNAIEAAAQCDEGFIRLKMFMQNDGTYAVIKLENSYKGNIIKEGERLLTTKEDEDNHGIGVERVRELAERYQGSLINTISREVFQAVLVLVI